MDFQNLLDKRYSVREFDSAPVERRKLDSLLEAGRIAPTASNRQPVRILVAQSMDDLALIDDCSPCRFGAPLVLVVCYDKTASWKSPFKEDWNSGQIDAGIVTTYMMLKAEEQGVGTLWVVRFDPDKTAEYFKLPESLVPITMLMLGYPAESATPSESHSKRVSIENMLIGKI
jgi:nitroreductase